MLDSDFSDELVINEEVEEFKRMNYTSSEEEEEDYIYYKPTAPPPSPQEPSMLDMIFSNKEDNKSVYKERELMEHAQTLDKLLRRTLQQNKHPKLKNIMKAAASDKLKKTFIIDEETSLMIHELREMGL
ncbi:hypothetical protein G6F57_013301 [Rhizopus arrhizus]|uniref:Uncharacterized protein n=1 Tax=Rhizopus oryzae TaxID=64495 RepID=A0A9P6WXV1_RHIOR|nr:hypothetical protein G6F23_010715 [Rhizopus arrhizus]KAG1399486.1 hypothetical protein G6F58_011126 [Rhizopus delemar]KAG0759483.1 hypothetical protein G6F24_009027 [Rhizopus arrhizus]KAG0780209.1 hypothetical protein G6F22_010209 [Rhizopus arrhizus]KAG0780457.1 hypothetical protein G6F21_012124 [Rhizopus arrhizus]